MIIYKKMSLFDAPEGSILVHGCNAKGVWGSGIAKEFKLRFPNSFLQYHNHCKDNGVGTFFLTEPENTYKVGCLITSNNYGNSVDSKEKILENTKKALNDMIKPGISAIYYSNKFNSGLFKVPWEETEKLLESFTKKLDIDWVICDPYLIEKSK